MLLIYPSKKSHEEVEKKSGDAAPAARPADWPYMELSGQILKNPPETWKVYPKTEDGLFGIIDMEYHELQNAIMENRPKEDIMRELVHLGTATLAMWRHYNAAE